MRGRRPVRVASATAQKRTPVATKAAPAPVAAAPAATAPAARADSTPAPKTGKGVMSFSRETYSYAGGGRRDQFKSLLAVGGELRPVLSDLKLVTIVFAANGQNSVAILRDLTTKEQYRVRVGQTLGRMRVAAIDCGTNSTRLLIAERSDAPRGFDIVDRRMKITRLGQGVNATKMLAPEAIARTAEFVPGRFRVVERVYRGIAHSVSREELDDVSAFLRVTLGLEGMA